MTEFVPLKEYESTVESINKHLSSISVNVSKMDRRQEDFILSQTEINTTHKCKLKEHSNTHKTYKKIGFRVLFAIIGLSGIGAATVLTPERDHEHEEKEQVLVRLDNDTN